MNRPLHLLHGGLLMALTASSALAQGMAAKGSTGMLVVEYQFESVGKSQNAIDLRQWKISRSVTVTAELVAQAASPGPTLHPADPSAAAGHSRQAQAAAAAARDMQPMMQAAEAIAARCGNDEKCLERETMKLGFGSQGTPPSESSRTAAAELGKAAAARYQRWHARAQASTYQVDESLTLLTRDPLCMELKNKTCTRSETRRGGGALAEPKVGGAGAAEFDAQTSTFALQLPLPLGALGVDETVATDMPNQKAANGTRRRDLNPGLVSFKPLLQPIQPGAGARNQTGERSFEMTDPAGFPGKLTVRWKLTTR